MDEDVLFDEIGFVNNIVCKKHEEWEKANLETDKRWCDVFHTLKSTDTSCKNIETLLSFALAVPGANAVVEKGIFHCKFSLD